MKLHQRILSAIRHDGSLFELPTLHRNKILQSLLLVNVFFILLILIFSLKIHHMVNYQNGVLSKHLNESAINESASQQFMKRYTRPIYTQVFLQNMRLIDQKAEVMPVDFAMVMTYPESWLANREFPQISLDNGTILNSDEQLRQIKNGMVEDGILYSANVITNYIPDMYPLDKQVIVLQFSAKDTNESNTNFYYFKIDEFNNHSQTKGRNYRLVKDGFFGQTESFSLQVGPELKTFHDYTTDCYLLFSHKNMYSYLKTTQYLILSILIAVFALLINPRSGDSISGRVSVIGSAVFSLATNVFQINTLIRTTSGITLIDLMSAFAGSVILVCFLITSRSIRFKDKYGYDASKIHDLWMFWLMLFYPLVFFVITYLQA